MGAVREPERFDTLIIGGGQAGLAVGYHLMNQGRRFVILDAAERIGDSWRTRWDSLRLFTPARLDGLPGWPFPASAWSFPTKDDMADYVEHYATRFSLPVHGSTKVDRLYWEAGRLVATSGDLQFEADNVVVATGGFQSPRLPAFAAELHPDVVRMHSSQYRRPAQLQPGDVLVVGAANSGADIALELSRTRQTWLSGRHPGSEPVRPGSVWDRIVTPPFWFAASRVLTVHTRAGRRVRSTLQSGGHPLARVKPADLDAAGVNRLPRTVAVHDGIPAFEDGRSMDVPNVIWCTGFQPDFSWIDLPVFDDDGLPVHDRGVVAAQPGLYFVGLPFLYSLTSSLVGGVGRDAKHIAEHIAARSPLESTQTVASAESTSPTPLPRRQ